MASKVGLAGGIPERRVRPIWDSIESRQFKNALKLSASLLSKYPNSPYAIALKALVLERMGKNEEALSVCLNAKKLLHANDSVSIDDLTLSTLQIVFQRLDHLDLATSCYEHACTKFPNNRELMMGLFNCYVREYSFVKQQQISIKMYKIGGEEMFLLWAVCSIQLQVLCGNGEDKLLLLAEGLLKKHITSHSLHEPEALIVYISLLEQQSKFKDALEVLSGNLGSLIMIEVDRLRVKGRLLARAGDYAAAVDVFQKVLELWYVYGKMEVMVKLSENTSHFISLEYMNKASPDDWECFLHYLGCLLEDGSCWPNTLNSDLSYPRKYLNSNFSHLTEELFDSRISNASVFVQKLLEEAKEGYIRGPHLALIEIERTKALFGKGNEDELLEAVMGYFFRFGHLASFTFDVDPFVQILSPGKKEEFAKKLTKNMEPTIATPKEVLGKSITVFKIQELVGTFFNLPTVDLVLLASQMVDLYYKNLPLSKDLDPQDSVLGEELLSLVSNILVQLFWRTKHLGYLVEAIMILEFGLTVRRYAWQYKIMLLHLYSHWGALPLAYQWYKSLDVKNILLETVSHHILPQMLVSPLWIDLNDLLSNYLKFMDDHFRESADLAFLAYRHRNYSKVIEFIQLKERLQCSSQYLVAKIEAPILQLKQHSDNVEEEECILENLKCGIELVELSNKMGSKTLTFNEDLQSRPWWTPTYDRNYLLGPFQGVSYRPKENLDHQIRQTQVHVQKSIEKRSLLPRLIYLSIRCASSSVKENVEANGSVPDTSIPLELKALLERYTKFLGFPFQDAVELVVEISSGEKSLEAIRSDLIDWVNFAVFLNAWNLNSNELKQNIWNVVNSLIEKYILEEIESIGSVISSPGSNLPTVIQLVSESFSWHSLVIRAYVRSSLIPSGKKKKKGGGPQPPSGPIFSQGIRDSIESLSRLIEKVSQWLKEEISSLDEKNVELILSSIETKDHSGGGGGGPGKVLEVLETSVSSLSDVDVGDQIFQAVKSWSRVEIARRMVKGHQTVLLEFLQICESKVKSLGALKSHV